MKELKSLLEYIFHIYESIERRKAMGKDFEAYQESLIKQHRMVRMIEDIRYGYSSLNWCFISPELVQNSNFTHCRDFINESLQASITNSSHSYYPAGHYPKIATDKLRMMFVGVDDERFKNAIHTTNIYARLAGWEETIYTKAKVENHSWSVFVVFADKNWIRYPQLLSIFILIIRFIRRINMTPDYVNDAYSLEAYWEEIVDECVGRYGLDSIPNDVSYMRQIYKRLIPIFVHEKEIFDKEMPKAWTVRTFTGDSGIHSLINGKLKDHREETKRLNNFYEAEVRKYERRARKMYNWD